MKLALLIGAASLTAACAARNQVAADVSPAPPRPASAAGTLRAGTISTRSTTAAATPGSISSTAEANSVDQSLIKRGYRTTRRNGALLYCQTQTLTGTHFNNTVCLTEAQIRARDRDTQSSKDLLNHEGRPACPSGGCD